MKRGEQVERYGLKKRIIRAKLLAFHYENNTLVGVAAIKQPYKTYIKRVFENAGVSNKYYKYKLEIGWAFTIPEFRGNGICSNLMKKLISTLQFHNIFATARTDNLSIQKILMRNRFHRIGNSYQGRTNIYSTQLFILED